MNPRSQKMNPVIGSSAILIVLAISVMPLPGDGTRGQDPTGASEAANPYDIDSDGDGISDGDEIASGHDPASNQSFPPRWVSTQRRGATMATPAYVRADWDTNLSQAVYVQSGPITVDTLFASLAGIGFPLLAPDAAPLPAGYSTPSGVAGGYRDAWGGGELSQSRCWLQSKPAVSTETKRTVLRVTTGVRQPWGPQKEETSVIEKLEVVIPANATQSEPIDLLPTFATLPNLEEEQQITSRLLPVEVSWKAIDGFDNVDDHIDPWNKPINGKRIFPDFKNPGESEIQHKLEVIVKTSPALFGKTVYVKAFDVDDSTSEEFDHDENGTTPVIDTNGKAGNDNLIDYLNTPQNGQFWTGSAWGGQTTQGTVDENGETKFIFRVGMQPGSNYRVVASVIDEAMYAGVQTSNPTAAKYLGPEASQNGGAAASPLLTVWRRLWVENDSMKAPGLHSDGYLKNDLTSDVSSPTVKNTVIGNGQTIVQFNPVISDQSSLRNLENGSLILPPNGSHQPIGSFANYGTPWDGVTISGAHPDIQPWQPFRLYDDDDFGLNRAPLPRNDLIDDTFKNVYKPAFIEVVDAANFKGQDYNPSKTVDFYRNHAVMVGPWFPINLQTPGVWDDAIDLADSKPLWIGNLIAGYQGEVGDDRDPSSEGLMEGITPGSRRYSIVYVENVRDQNDAVIRNASADNTAMNSEIARNIKLTAAHEIGHMPGGGDETSHHAENMLMDEDGYGSDNGLNFSPKSILRFRKTNQWQQP